MALKHVKFHVASDGKQFEEYHEAWRYELALLVRKDLSEQNKLPGPTVIVQLRVEDVIESLLKLAVVKLKEEL